MQRDRFYALIDSARSGGTEPVTTADPEALSDVLGPLSDAELAEFVVAYDDELVRLNRWDVWGAGYVAAGGMSDDGFHYFRSWLIGKGRRVVDAVLADPDALADHLDDGDLENESLEYSALDLLEERGVADPRDADEARSSPDDDPDGEPFDEEHVDERYPRTAAAAA